MHTTFRRVRFVRIETRLRSRGIHCHAIRANFSNARCICVRSIEIHRPLPHISSHVIQPVAIGGKTFHHRCTRETIVRRVLTGKLTLPCVATLGEQLITHGLIAPHIDFLRESSARRILPLGFRRQSFARPLAIRERINKRDMHNRLIQRRVNRRRWSSWMLPISAERPSPPPREIIRGHRSTRWRKH